MVTVLPENAGEIKPENKKTLRYSVRVKGNSGFVFMTNFQDHAERQDQENLQIEIKLPDESITIPANSGFTLKKETSAIFPFNISLDGVHLNYATAQLLTKLEDSEGMHFFFYKINGIAPEFQFDSESLKQIKKEKGRIENKNKHTYFYPEAGVNSTANIIKKNGSIVKITTLTREQALNTWNG